MVRDAAVEVRKPTMFGELIIMIVYLPILTLEGVEGKLFHPMALTVIFALLGSMVLSLTLMPVLASLLLPKKIDEREPLLMRLAHRINAPILRFCMNNKLLVMGFALCVLVVAFGMIAPNLGSEFVPRLSEGAIVINVVRLAGTDIDESIRTNTLMEKAILRAFPDEVEHVWSRIGTAEIATDPMGVELTDLFITLKPRSRWKKASTQAELTSLIDKELRDIPGQRLAFTQPIEMRINEMVSGGRTDVAVKVFGDDFATLVAKGREIERVLHAIPGNADLAVEQITGQPVLEIQVKQDEIARYGIPAKVVLDLIESIGSKPLGEIVEGQLRFPMVVRLPENYRANPGAIGGILVATASGERVPLSRLATMRVVEGPSTITREWGQRRITVTCNVRGRDLGSFVAEARQKMAQQVQVPQGRYHVEWGGQFEQLESARTRLLIVVPLTFVLIFGLLYLTYGNIVDALRVFTSIPFAWVGGIVALWLRDMPFSISAAIGFIALSGVAVLNDMILVSYVRQLRAKGISMDDAVQRAATTRLRPVLMTTLVASLGFLPMAFSTSMGAEVQRPWPRSSSAASLGRWSCRSWCCGCSTWFSSSPPVPDSFLRTVVLNPAPFLRALTILVVYLGRWIKRSWFRASRDDQGRRVATLRDHVSLPLNLSCAARAHSLRNPTGRLQDEPSGESAEPFLPAKAVFNAAAAGRRRRPVRRRPRSEPRRSKS